MYHSVSRHDDDRKHPYYQTNTRPEVFCRHMQILAGDRYRVISLKESLDLIKRQKDQCETKDLAERLIVLSPKRPVVLTFDDGFYDFYDNAWPILQRHSFNATMFLPASFIGDERRRLAGRECLTWREVRKLASEGMDFGAHTVCHTQIYRADPAIVEKEIGDSKNAIELALGRPVMHYSYAYAFPEHDAAFVEFYRYALMRYGYQGAVTTRIGTASTGDDPYTLRRIPVNSGDDEALFRAKLEGAYDWLAWLQLLFKKLRGRVGSLNGSTGLHHGGISR